MDLSDPNTYSSINPKTGKPFENMRRQYAYLTSVSYTTKSGVQKTQYVTLSTNNLLTEEQIVELADVYFRASSKYEFDSGSTSIDITGAYTQPEE